MSENVVYNSELHTTSHLIPRDLPFESSPFNTSSCINDNGEKSIIINCMKKKSRFTKLREKGQIGMRLKRKINVMKKKDKKGMKKKKKSGVLAMQEIKKHQKSVQTLVPNSPFHRLISEISSDMNNCRFTKDAKQALQESAEMFIVEIFQDAQALAFRRKKKTVTEDDFSLAARLKNGERI
jgi:histone H3/H4